MLTPPPLTRFFPPQPQSALAGAGLVAGFTCVTEPFNRPNTSVTTSRIKVSFTALIAQLLLLRFRAKNLFPENIHGVHDADDDRVHRAFLQIWREAGGTALAKHHHFANAGADTVNGHDGVHAGA